MDGQTEQKTRLAKKRLLAGLEMGGLGIPYPVETIWGFQQNSFKKIYKKDFKTPHQVYGLLDRAKQPTLDHHIKCFGPKQWQRTGNRLKPWNRLL